MEEYVTQIVPQALGELGKNEETIKQIAEFCNASYEGEKETEVFGQTKEYTTNALLNVAYHIQTIVNHVSAFVGLQKSELDNLEVQIRTLTDRVRSHYDVTGAAAFRPPESSRVYRPRPKISKLEGDKIPANARPLPKFNRDEATAGGGGAQQQTIPVSTVPVSPRTAAPPAPAMPAPPPLPARR